MFYVDLLAEIINRPGEQEPIPTSSQQAGENEPSTSSGPPAKKARSSVLYSCYERGDTHSSPATVRSTINSYLDCIKNRRLGFSDNLRDMVKKDWILLIPLFEYLFSVPATSAPVERIFSQSGLFVRPHRAKLGDKMLANLVFLKCNNHII